MHIVFLGMFPHQKINTGGIGSFIHTLAKSLVQKGCRVTVISTMWLKEESDEIIDGIRVIRLYAKKWKFLNGLYNTWRTISLLKKIHRQHPIDIVEGAESNFAFITIPAGIKKVIRLHGGHYFFTKLLSLPLNKKLSLYEKKSFAKADYFIGVTEFVVKITGQYLPIPADKQTVIYLPVDCRKFYEADPAKMVPYSIVFAGTVTEKKGIRQLVMAMPTIVKQHPQTVLHIYGNDWIMPDGSSFTQTLQSLMGEDIRQHVQLHGQVPNQTLPGIFETAHICAFPSHMETQGLVVLEAMSMGKAVLFSTTGPGPETIEHLKDGLLADPYSPEDIAEKIMYLFARLGLENELGKKARQKMLQRYDVAVVTEQNLAFYQRITGKLQ